MGLKGLENLILCHRYGQSTARWSCNTFKLKMCTKMTNGIL